MPDAHHVSKLFQLIDWRIDGRLPRRLSDRVAATQMAYCSPRQGRPTCTHVAKYLTNDATEQQWLHFERQAYIAVKLGERNLRSTYCCLTPPCALLIHPRLDGLRLDDWLHDQPQLVARSVWVAIAHELLLRLEALHKLGYVHDQLIPEHVWIDSSGGVYLLGLGRCAAVGEILVPRETSDRFDAPERRQLGIEATSAQDVYSAAAVIDLISGGQFAKSPVGNCMQAPLPYDRPTAGELVELFSSYQRELNGVTIGLATRAA